MLRYGAPNQYDITEYEAYFSFISYFYSERVEIISLPYVIRQPTFCNYFDAPTLSLFLDSDLAYFTCHDRYDTNDFYVNCNGNNCRVTTTFESTGGLSHYSYPASYKNNLHATIHL